jgi:hypothetical protein
MLLKLSNKQQSQLAFLSLCPPKFQRFYSLIEQLNAPKVDESLVRGLARQCEEMKAGATQLGLGGFGDSASNMASIARRGGGQQVKVRALRDALGALKMNYEGALKKASTPRPPGANDEAKEE